MTIGVIGRKAGMTRVFTEDGGSTPVTVIEVASNRITQIKTDETDGYQAIQVTTGSKKASRVTKPMAGHFAKAGVEAGRGLWEFRVNGDEAAELEVGGELSIEMFEAVGQKYWPVYFDTVRERLKPGAQATLQIITVAELTK